MKEMTDQFLRDVLLALYQPFGYAVLTAVLAMFLYLYIQENGGGRAGARKVFRRWKEAFLHDGRFRRFLLLAFYTIMLLFRTLLNRNLWENPLSDILGGWVLLYEDGTFNTEPVENLLLFVPFTALLLWAAGDRALKGRDGFLWILWRAGTFSFLFSLGIEFFQLLLRLGTFQLSDLVYNTVGGVLGGLLFWIIEKRRFS